jgi:hypothetical protein
MAVPYTFSSATAAIPLSQLDSNFATAITLGNTAVYLGNTTSSLGNLSLTNVTIVSVSAAVTASQGGTGLTAITANNVMLGNGTGSVQVVAPGTSGNVLTSNGTTWTSSAALGQTYPGAGIPNSTGSAWGTSYSTTGSGTVVALATNPTITNYTESVVAIGTVTTTNTISLTSGTVQTATLTASTACTFTMPTATAGKSFILLLKQAAATGNGTATFTSVKWGTAGAPTITATAGKMDILTFVADGTNWYGSIAQGYTP